jgi:hypothetical protein
MFQPPLESLIRVLEAALVEAIKSWLVDFQNLLAFCEVSLALLERED